MHDVYFESLEGEEADEGFASAETDGFGDDFLEFGRGEGPLGCVEGEAFPWDGVGVERDGGRGREWGRCDEGRRWGRFWGRGGYLYCGVCVLGW